MSEQIAVTMMRLAFYSGVRHVDTMLILNMMIRLWKEK